MTDFPKWVRERAAELVEGDYWIYNADNITNTHVGDALCRHIMQYEPEYPMLTAVRSALAAYESAKGLQSNALRVHDGHYDDLVLLVVKHLRDAGIITL